MHAYYTACMYHGKKEGAREVYWHPFCDLHPRPWQLWKPPSITLSLPPLPFPSLHQWIEEDMSRPCWTFSINSLYCSTLDHAPAPTTVVVVVELFTNYYNCSYRKFTRNVPIVGKIPTINRKESSSTCMNTIKAKPPLEKPRFCNNQLAHS